MGSSAEAVGCRAWGAGPMAGTPPMAPGMPGYKKYQKMVAAQEKARRQPGYFPKKEKEASLGSTEPEHQRRQ